MHVILLETLEAAGHGLGPGCPSFFFFSFLIYFFRSVIGMTSKTVNLSQISGDQMTLVKN